jgi:hypothetical protein
MQEYNIKIGANTAMLLIGGHLMLYDYRSITIDLQNAAGPGTNSLCVISPSCKVVSGNDGTVDFWGVILCCGQSHVA